MTTESTLEAFLASPEAGALAGVPDDARAEVAHRLYAACDDIGAPLEKLGATDVHGFLLHAVPDRFDVGDPLAAHVVPVARAMLAFTERVQGRALKPVRAAFDEMLPELDEALRTGHAHHHHHDHDDEEAPPETYVR